MDINEKGRITHDGVAIGQLDGDTIVLNGGWLKAAGLKLKVNGDPDTDHLRTVLTYPKNRNVVVDDHGDEHPSGTVTGSGYEAGTTQGQASQPGEANDPQKA